MEIVLFGYRVSLQSERFDRYQVEMKSNDEEVFLSYGRYNSLSRASKVMRLLGRRTVENSPDSEVFVRVIDMKTGTEVDWDRFYSEWEVNVRVVSYR